MIYIYKHIGHMEELPGEIFYFRIRFHTAKTGFSFGRFCLWRGRQFITKSNKYASYKGNFG